MDGTAGGVDASEGAVEAEAGAGGSVWAGETGTDAADDSGDDGTFAVGPSTDVLDLAYLRDLLTILNTHKVAGFSGAGIQVTFQEETPWEGAKPAGVTVADENRSTSSRQVGGFAPSRDGFRHPSLWQGQNGKILKLNGDLE